MHIRKLRLFDFKNYHEADVVFSPEINCITGSNGSGKTNLIDAIYYQAITRSGFNLAEKENIRHGSEAFLIQGEWVLQDTIHQVACGYRSGQPKKVLLDGKEYERLSDHIGKLPVVLVTPYDTDLIRGGSELRRKFFDGILCQADHEYLNTLMAYNHVLKQRNAALKKYEDPDPDLLQPYSRQLIDRGQYIYEERRNFLEIFSAVVSDFYNQISEEKESVTISYRSDGSEGLAQRFEATLRRDIRLERTTAGIHRDDFVFEMNDRAIRKFGSQGQQKSLILALKLAQFTYLGEIRNVTPIILLDDIFDKLDRNRVLHLMEILRGSGVGQVFITDAREDRTRQLMAEQNLSVTYFKVENGEVQKIE